MTEVILPPLQLHLTPNRSARTFGPVTLVVVHDPEGWFAGTDATIMDPHSEVSYHVLLAKNGSHAIQYVPWGQKAWSCMAFNSHSDNVSIEGFADKPYDPHGIAVLARIVAFRLKKRHLPGKYVPKGRVAHGMGWTYHSDLGVIGGGHHDPGFSSAVHRRFAGLVAHEYERAGFREHWGEE